MQAFFKKFTIVTNLNFVIYQKLMHWLQYNHQ